MRYAPYRKDRLYDEYLDHVLDGVDEGLSNDDDFFLICGGDPNTGKTRLMFHAYTRYAGELASIKQIAMNHRDFAIAVDNGSRLPVKRFVGYDEANVSKREALTKVNKKTIDLYLNIRGLNIFHWWNNPSVEMLDKPFIEERVKGMIFILTKSKKLPRIYLYFTKEGLLDLLEERGDLKRRTIKKFGRQYAYYQGWFKDYQGSLLSDYQRMKHDRMHEKVRAFREEFAPVELKSLAEVGKTLGVGKTTMHRVFKFGKESRLLREEEHYMINAAGLPKLTSKGADEAEYILRNGLHYPTRENLGAAGTTVYTLGGERE